ncbi:unnamed protein product [Onchocerca flexuosa]|uniref:Secreted protein n=1 Tax=Onchocerca flexuosa TaxID=387005 RepID=A0A183HHF6_9BILA|nr:unnamed protein product [Onchocerca flexuosa]
MVCLMVLELEKIHVVTSSDQYLQRSVVTLVEYKLTVTILIELFCTQLDLTAPGIFFSEKKQRSGRNAMAKLMALQRMVFLFCTQIPCKDRYNGFLFYY